MPADAMKHVVLLGDSVFDNAPDVPGQPAVIEQRRSLLSTPWRATLLAVDGHLIQGVPSQSARLPNYTAMMSSVMAACRKRRPNPSPKRYNTSRKPDQRFSIAIARC